MSLPELALLIFSAFYGPLLVITAIAIYVSSLAPARRGASWLERRARSTAFWMVFPALLAAVVVLVLATGTTTPAEALPSGPAVTLTKTTTTHFTQPGATLSRYVDPSADQLTLFSNLSPSTAMSIGPLMPFVDGDGAHAIESPIGEFLILHGEKQNVSSVLSELTATTLTGPAFNDGAGTPTPIGASKGAFAIARGDGTFLLIMGGDTDPQPTPPAPQLRPLATQVITPATSLGGAWTAAPGPNLSGTSGAGLGAHAVKFTVGGINKLLIVHAGGGVAGTADTSLYTPPQCQSGVGTPPACTGGTFIAQSMVAGPTFASNKKAAKGAVAVPRGDGTFLVVLAGGANDTQIYTPPTTTGGIGSFAVGPALSGPADDGTFAIQYKNAANADRYAIVRGGANSAVVYDPNATPATSAGMLGSLSIPTPTPARGGGKVGAGAAAFLRPDGTVVGFYGSQETLAFTFTPTASAGGADLANNGAFTALNLTNSVPMDRGSFVLHQGDGRILVFPGSSVETRYNDAGWALSGTYESEAINAGDVDQWTSLSWTRGPDDLKLEWRAARAKDLLANATYATIATSGGQTGTAAIAPGTTNKWVQVRATFKRAGTASTGAQASVWLGSSSVVQRRALTSAAPILSDFALGYTAGVFVLSARSPETAGVGFPLTVELRDSANARIVDYQGNHTLTFAGASVAPDGQSRPTIRDRAGADVAFGQPTGLSFEATGLGIGTATRRATLYRKEEIDLTATETVTSPGPFVAFTLSTHTLTTQAAAHVLVNAAGPSATKSTLVAAPTVVKPNGTDVSTLTLTITDAFGNILPGLQATLASDRGSVDTFSRTTLPPSDFSGKSTATLSSTTRGVASVTATVLGPPTDVAIPQRFFGTTVTAFRAGPAGSTLWQAPTTVPVTAVLTSTTGYGTATGSRQVVPGTANSTAGSPGSSATNKGWRDESYARASQSTTAGRLSGDWTFSYSLALTTGTQPVTAQMTVVAYAVDAANTAREMFRNTTTDLSVGPAELNHTQTFTPSYAVLNGVAGHLAAGELLQYELFLNVSQNPNSSSGSVVQIRAGSAGNALAPPDVAAGAISDLPNTTQQTVLTPVTKVSFFGGQVPITLSKTTASHFAAGTPGTGVTTSAAGIALSGTPDGGGPLTGSYETEALNPGNVDRWDRVAWTKSSEGTVTVSARVATSQAGLSSAAYVEIATAQAASGSAALNGAVGSRWVQLKVALARTAPSSSGGPFVTRLGLDYLSGALSVSAAATQTAGTTNLATITLRDSANTVITDYAGSHTLVLAGANAAPDGTQPKATTPTSADAATVPFGGATALAFASGSATTTLTLYRAETAALTASETVAASTGSAYDLTGYAIDVNGPASVLVSAAAAAAAKSSATASPPGVPADNATVSTIAVRVKDQFENPIAGLTTVTLGSFQSTAGDRAGLDTLTNPATTSAAGLGSGTIRSTRFGTVTITVSVGGSPLAIPSPPTVTFGASTFTVVTQNNGTETAGAPFTLTITAKDASGTTVTSYAGSKTIAFTTTARPRTTPAAGPAPIVTTPQLVGFTAGVATTSASTGSACNQPGTTPCRFTLYNTAQTPTITATDGAFPTGTSAPITIVPATPSLTVSTFVADPLVVAPDNKDNSNLTVRVMDAFGNPVSGRTVTFSSSRGGSDNFFQPIGTTGADGIAVGQITSLTVGTPTVSAAIAGVGTLSTTRVINFVQPGGATRVLLIRTQNIEQETAGVAFSLTVIGIKADGTQDPTFCNAASCSITLSNTALAAPDGTVPTGTVTKNAPNFVNGQYTTNATDGNLVTFFRANQQPAPIITVTVSAPNASIIGLTPPITVRPSSVNLTRSYVYAVPDLVPADGTSTAALGAKILDTWKNPVSGRGVTFASSRGGSDLITQPSEATGGLGIAFGSISSTVASVPGQASTFATITGTVTGVGAIATTGSVTFFGSPGGGRIQNGTRPGAVVNGAATDFTLAIVARDLEGLELPTDTIINWTLRGQGGGTFSTTATTSGFGTPMHATQFTATRAGTITITGGYVIPAERVGAGTQVAVDLTFKIVSQFDVTATTIGGKVVTSRVEWDGTTLRTISWTTSAP